MSLMTDPAKPKWMRWATYQRRVAQIELACNSLNFLKPQFWILFNYGLPPERVWALH